MPKGIYDKGENFPCGHPREQFYEVTRKQFNKTTQEITLYTYKVCKKCVQRISNANNRKYIKRKTNKRWKIVNGKRVIFRVNYEN